MLNKCTDKGWFVVELCESMKAWKIELANFELFSSGPHEFRVSMVDTYPAREKDWALFGEFSAADDRSVQSFDGEGVFGKFAKVEILSHHGSEHYCPVSLFRIFGISEIELMGVDEEEDEEDVHHGLAADDEIGLDEKKGSGIVNYIKEKVDATINRVVGVFRPKDQVKYYSKRQVQLLQLMISFNFSDTSR